MTDRRRAVRIAGMMTMAVALTVLAACSSGTTKKHAATTSTTTTPSLSGSGEASTGLRWLICGQNLSQSQAGLYIEDASDHDITVTRISVDNVYLQFSHDCNADVHYQVVPPSAANLVAASPPNKPVAVVLHPFAQKFVVTFQRPSGPGKVTVDFTQPPPTLGQ